MSSISDSEEREITFCFNTAVPFSYVSVTFNGTFLKTKTRRIKMKIRKDGEKIKRTCTKKERNNRNEDNDGLIDS